MPYPYQSVNYAAGDYYQAGGLFGSIGKALVGGAKGFITGGPVGAIGGAVKAVISQPTQRKIEPLTTRVAAKREVPAPAGQIPVPGFTGAVQRFMPGGASGYETVGGGTCGVAGMGGYHPNKALVRYANALARGGQRTDPRTRPRVVNECVRNRAMNPANPRALRRAIRREAAFVALARRTLRGSGYTIKRTGLARKKTTRRK